MGELQAGAGVNGLSDNLKGALYMTVAMLAFLINDSLMKAMSGDLPLMQAIALRGIGTTLVLLAAALAMGGLRLRLPAGDWLRIAVRTAAEAASAGLYIAALFHLPIANTTAILQALPLTVTLAGALFLGDRVGWRRMAAILVGFAGVLLIVRPGPDGFNHYSVLAILSVFSVTLRDIVTRRLGTHVPSMTVATAAAAGSMALGLAGSVGGGWVPVGSGVAIKLAACVVALLLGYVFSVKAMRVGEIAAVTPFRYTNLIFALIVGLVVFHEWPDRLTLAGAAIVVATGLFTLWRERRIRQPEGPVPLRVR